MRVSLLSVVPAPRGLNRSAQAPLWNCDPALFGCNPAEGEGQIIRQSGASPYMSANFAACLNISINIFRVSFPVCVF